MEKEIQAKIGRKAEVMAFGLMFVFVMGLLMVLDDEPSPRNGQMQYVVGYLMIALSLLSVFVTYPVIRGTIVSKQGVKRPRNLQWLPAVTDFEWANVSSITDQGGWLSIQFISPIRGRKATVINTDYLSNSEEMSAAAFEAAFLANPNVEIKSPLFEKHGKPPYGIFS